MLAMLGLTIVASCLHNGYLFMHHVYFGQQCCTVTHRLAMNSSTHTVVP